ncbi:hypothetical protein ACGFIV_12990 [Sphaerisporangium sp. NPDC049003]
MASTMTPVVWIRPEKAQNLLRQLAHMTTHPAFSRWSAEAA